MKHTGTPLPIRIAAASLASLITAGCGTTTAASTTAAGTTPQPAASPREAVSQKPPGAIDGLAGHRWRIVAIGHDGTETPIPARYDVYLSFTANGSFGGNDPVNYHSGTYRLVNGGFITGKIAATAMGYAGDDPIVTLTASALSAFGPGVRAAATLTGNRLKVTVGGYLLNCQRDSA